ncbi:Hpt domain-containing protein [Vibrio parahaemolyticus]|nr:Hpt domain-containing protein [Vibrio parahaemolyticus]MCI9695090.1 Hpt domain-containing protein [Vibrio parahaemolyticus]MCI9709532.1 Hpt domain-containing protein [Vibrio parahaemolyticus]MCI9714403.1 Hpt domain-containing protein [Vibrio parahaemolyticus]MCR9720746.1 Hpt domain-containing protein [Vibrio parahaemolyticus]MCR9945248.1 Hpt domain-containing protein [Vibrio parahaemolyticus]
MHQLRAGIKRIIWFLFILWCVFSATLWFQAKQTMQTLSTLNELGSKVEEVRNFFNFELPYRVKHVDQVSLKLQLVYAVRLQLESEVSDANGPDVTQLLYSTDRFLESARAFIGSDGELVSLAEQLHTSRGAENNSQQIENMYYRLGALVLESIFSDSNTNTDTYRELDLLFIESDSLSIGERSAFQRRLAQTSSVLAANAQGSYLANQLLKPDFPNQLVSMKATLEQKLVSFIFWLIVVSGCLLALGSWAVFSKNEVANSSSSDPAVSQTENASSSLEHENKARELASDAQANKTQELTPDSRQELLAPQEPFIDINRMLDSLSGDEGAVRMLLEVFIQDHAEDGSKLHKLLNEDIDNAQRAAHSLKGVSGSLGAMPLHYISGEIELLIKQGKEVPDNKLCQLRDVLQQTTLFAEKVLNSEKIREVLTD